MAGRIGSVQRAQADVRPKAAALAARNDVHTLAAMDARGRLRRSPEGPTVYDGEKLKGLDELFSSVRLHA